MTNPRNREQDRAVRAYKRAHPGITLAQARAAVAARSGQQPSLPARIPDAPLPRPGEQLDGYVKRVAAAAGVQRHRAMELLGLEPGTSATERLDHLGDGLPDAAVRALVAATGMTPEQARALTGPRAGIEVPALDEKHLQRGGTGKTRTQETEFARPLAEADGPRPDRYRPVIVDLDWPFDYPRPIDPEVFDTVAQALGLGQEDGADAPPHE
ncbi:hypothetical protein AB0J01_28390 [Streptomyces sp. NPDC050204]|uniref:hypothetical protein n=1 Tax=Streptomyces sp. NPDC050204 TaxID=3155514 RepID=UPI00343F3F08